MIVHAESEALHRRVRAFIACASEGAPSPEGFDELALSVARFQASRVSPFARLLAARGIDLARATSALEIPAVPCDVFRLTRVAAHPPEDDAVVFRTSGTSQGAAARGEHAMRDTATYELASLAWGRALLWPDRDELSAMVLAPPTSRAPDSSLSFMLDRFAERLGGPASWHVDGALDVAGIAEACRAARRSGKSAIVLGTSFALVHLLDAASSLDLALPEGSRVMQTGGFKGRSREVEPDALRSAIAGAFAVPPARVVGEYGMTELSSQLYETSLAADLAGRAARHGVFAAPPWVRVDAVDPITLRPVPPGEIGIARFVDLANVDSAVAVQTVDRVRVSAEGVELLGRAPGAPPRGCSLAIEEMLSP